MFFCVRVVRAYVHACVRACLRACEVTDGVVCVTCSLYCFYVLYRQNTRRTCAVANNLTSTSPSLEIDLSRYRCLLIAMST